MSFYSSSYYTSSYHGPVLGFNSNLEVAKGELEHYYIVNQLDITVTEEKPELLSFLAFLFTVLARQT